MNSLVFHFLGPRNNFDNVNLFMHDTIYAHAAEIVIAIFIGISGMRNSYGVLKRSCKASPRQAAGRSGEGEEWVDYADL